MVRHLLRDFELPSVPQVFGDAGCAESVTADFGLDAGILGAATDHAVHVTTGTFTPAAVKEATRDGAPPIDLLDGSEFADKLKELGIGMRIENIEVVRIEEGWFENV
jgi:restriction endonuclease Mrr